MCVCVCVCLHIACGNLLVNIDQQYNLQTNTKQGT